MALDSIEIIRLGIGDTDSSEYVLTDAQIQHYLASNSGNTDDTIEELKPIVLQILSVKAINIRTEDLWLDNRDIAKRYSDALDKAELSSARSAYPIIGGGTYQGAKINQFDSENDYDSDDTLYYNDYPEDA